MLSLVLMTAIIGQQGGDPPSPGVPEALAQERARTIGALRYDLTFVIPADPSQPVQGRAILRFSLGTRREVVLDFAQPPEFLTTVRARGRAVPFSVAQGHLIIPATATRAGDNEIAIEFRAGDKPLNRNRDFLYTLFVPARANRAFPCFDQPDLKARFTLSLEVPAGWEAVANSPISSRRTDAKKTRVRFAETPPIPTYLFAFAAGRFSIETARRNGRELRLFHRETDSAKVARNREVIFDLHARALAWLEDYTAIPYPFAKFDVIAIPSFQFNGMEHPGAMLYNAAALLLEESATQNQILERASLIAHETSHMWFGDLVTMTWFNDVWIKEVFATFMAGKIVNPSFPQVDYDLRFLMVNYPAAYQVDRTAGTSPIRQPLANLDEAGQLYGPMIYQKAPIVMRQLELIMGQDAFRDTLREYLKTYAFGNATWLDLVRLFDARTPADIRGWSRAWVEERGRPTFSTVLRAEGDRVSSLELTMTDPLERGLVWPQRLRIVLGYAGSVREVPVYVDATAVPVAGAAGLPLPLYVLPNGAGLGYGLFVLDPKSRDYLLGHLQEIPDPLTRGSAWITLWDNVLEGHVGAAAFLDRVVQALPIETDEQNIQRVLAYGVRAFWRHLTLDERAARSPALEAMLRSGIERARTSTAKSAWFSAFRDVALTPESLEWIERLWRRNEGIPGLAFGETDEIGMALELAVREVSAWREILQLQHDRTQDPDRKARFAFVMPAVSADPSVREGAFARLAEPENRRREPWVVESMAYLNHPMREAHARRFIQPSLELLRDVQRDGDIFFSTRWIEAALGGHRSPEAAGVVRDFLARELQFPQRLRWTVLSAADELFRVSGAAGSRQSAR